MLLESKALKEAEYEYGNLPLDRLVLLAVKAIEDRALPILFENIVAAAFSLFPRRFQMRGYPDWPDTLLVYRTLERCRVSKRWLTGSTQAGFQLTEAGRSFAASSGPSNLTGPGKRNPTRDADAHSVALVQEFRQSRAFRNWQRSGSLNEHLTEYLLALHCTSSTQCRVQRSRYDDLFAAAVTVGDEEIIACLQELKRQFPDIFDLP